MGVKFFRFPKDQEIRAKWIEICKKTDNFNADNALICSVHFSTEDYADDMKSRLLGIKPPQNKRTLNDDAVPKLFLDSGECKQITEC